MYKGQEIVNLAEKQLGTRGSAAKAYCGLPSGANYCDAFVSWLFYKENCRDLFCDGKKQTYCPTSIKLVRKQMPMLPIYLGLPGDVIFFDWEPNGDPNHIGIVRSRASDLEIDTVEGNTSGYGTTGVVANKTRPYFIPKTKRVQIQGMFRPQFAVDKSEFDASKKLTIDGLFGFNSIACLQKVLKSKGYYSGAIDAVMGLGTVKGIQKAAGVEADGSWGPNTTKAVQKMTGAKVDGFFGPASVKALQTWINKQMFPTLGDKIADTAKSYVGKVKYVKGGTDLKKGVDCTGFVQAIYGLNGIKLDNKLSSWGPSIGKDVSKALPGDIFTYKDKSGIHHGIYVGDGKVVHAANPKQGVIKSKWNSMSRPLVGIRRRWK